LIEASSTERSICSSSGEVVLIEKGTLRMKWAGAGIIQVPVSTMNPVLYVAARAIPCTVPATARGGMTTASSRWLIFPRRLTGR